MTFEKSLICNNYLDLLSILDTEILGAAGWMAVDAPTSELARDELIQSLLDISLNIVKIERLEEIFDLESYMEFDEQLFENVQNWEFGKFTVWGTLYQYYAEGEA